MSVSRSSIWMNPDQSEGQPPGNPPYSKENPWMEQEEDFSMNRRKYFLQNVMQDGFDATTQGLF